MQGIFINYRRRDSQSAAGCLADHIKENLADVPVFRDVKTIEPGVDFIVAITTALKRNDVRVIPVLVEGVRCPSPPAPPPGRAAWC